MLIKEKKQKYERISRNLIVFNFLGILSLSIYYNHIMNAIYYTHIMSAFHFGVKLLYRTSPSRIVVGRLACCFLRTALHPPTTILPM